MEIKNLWEKLEAQHKEELAGYNITRENIPQLMTSIAAMSVFPFVAKPIITGLFKKMGYDFNDYIEDRKEYAADFIINALKQQVKADSETEENTLSPQK